MIQKNGHYIITISDCALICKYFGVNPNTTRMETHPDLQWTEYRFYDIYTEGLLFTLYDHDGKFRVAKNLTEFHEVHISQVLAKKPSTPPADMQHAISKNVHKPPTTTKRDFMNFKKNRS